MYVLNLQDTFQIFLFNKQISLDSVKKNRKERQKLLILESLIKV